MRASNGSAIEKLLWSLGSSSVGFLGAIAIFTGELRAVRRDVAQVQVVQNQTLAAVAKIAAASGVALDPLQLPVTGARLERRAGDSGFPSPRFPHSDEKDFQAAALQDRVERHSVRRGARRRGSA